MFCKVFFNNPKQKNGRILQFFVSKYIATSLNVTYVSSIIYENFKPNLYFIFLCKTTVCTSIFYLIIYAIFIVNT